jgi:outer membrane lipoprotein-sorting protein
MRVSTQHWERTLSLEFWNKGKDRSLVRILSPKKEKGTATLKSGSDLWNYLPKVKRVIKLPSSMMSASWMGSHFTNDDLVKESRMAEDYDFEITFEGERDDTAIVEITLIPKQDAAVVWGRVVVDVRKENYLPVRLRYFDEDLLLARTMIYSQVGELGGRIIPAQITIRPADKPQELTAVTYEDMAFDIAIDDDAFSLRRLQK